MNPLPRVSIGLPVYNGERYLKTALDSLLGQTFADFELIISDNGSQDRTAEICQDYAKQDPRIRYYRHDQNRGAAWNQSHVVNLARGEYFKWGHHDDICAPEFLARCVEVLDRFPAVVLVYPKTLVIDAEEAPLHPSEDHFHLLQPRPEDRFHTYHDLVRNGHDCNPLHGLIRTATLQKTALIASYPSSDLVLLGELVLHGQFYELPEQLFFKRDHPQNSVRAFKTYRERVVYLSPEKRGKLQLTHWLWFFAYLKGIERAELDQRSRVACYLEMLRWCRWKGHRLGKDLLKAAAWPLLSLYLNRPDKTLISSGQVP